MLIGLFRILLILILIYFLVRLFRRLFASSGSDSGGKQQSKKKEGEVTIDHYPNKEKIVRGSKGDYVDFEEVKEKKD